MTRTTSARRPRSSDGSSAPAPTRRRHRYHTRSRAKRDMLLGRGQAGRITTLSDEEFRKRTAVLAPKAPEPMDTSPTKALSVESIDFLKMSNGQDHYTEDYELDDLVVRRGQGFNVYLHFDRPVDLDDDKIVIQFAFGTRPQESKGSLLRLPLHVHDAQAVSRAVVGGWTAKVTEVNGQVVRFTVTPPATAMVGRYGVFIETGLKNDADATRRFEMEDDELYLIFNPWCKEDAVYMEDHRERMEYVLNDKGRIWVGSARSNRGRPWNFGQFDAPVLEAALFLMDRGEAGDTARRSPVAFIRTISAQANSMDDDGLLEGRWTDDFPAGTVKPWAWTGSVKIIEQFMRTEKPVQFGQCWVFSGLVTSLLRALGIPTRSVTNFESAHDTDSSMTIDSHFDEDDEPVEWMDDSVWNFHVWNESWLRRADLPRGYDGWQAHDATPQETSEGVMRCGPAALEAIREGHVYLNHDVPFIFSEVNGDRVHWRVQKNGDMKVISINTHAVGKCISTKAVGSNFRNDLTLAYKHPENSKEERRVVEFVHNYSSRAEHNIYDTGAHDVQFDLDLPEVNMGEAFTVTARLKNLSKDKRSVKGRLTLLSSFYTGVPGKRVKGQPFTVDVQAGEEQLLELEVSKAEYFPKLNPEASFKVYASFTVQDTRQQWAETQAFTLVKPFLDIKVPDNVKARTSSVGAVSFTNPLDTPLTGASINLEGASVMSADEFVFKNPIAPGETVSHEFTICPRRAGSREIEATFTSDQLSGVDGSVEFEVQKAD